MSFRALRVHRTDEGTVPRLETLELDALTEGDVVIRAAWSGINYKDALAVTGKGRIMRRFPLVAGIDVAGVVEASEDPSIQVGQSVVVTGCGLGETHDGGFAERVRVPAEFVVPLPEGLDLRQAMALGTAGFTAGLAIELMERNRQAPEHGPIAVTGATGGVGSLAVDMLAGRGYDVAAITGKPDQEAYLRGLGATSIVDRNTMERSGKPLLKSQFGGAVDNLGGELLAWLLASTHPFGNVASIGLAASHKLDTTVMPLILRGVNLLGVNSVLTPRDLRLRVWERLASDLRPRSLEAIAQRTVSLDGIEAACVPMIEGRITGRTLVKLG